VGLDALFQRDDGTRDVAGTDSPWDEWVSASRTRNYLLDDPLLDWLKAHGRAKGFDPDSSGESTDFGAFLLRQGLAFEAAVFRHLAAHNAFVVVAQEREDARSEAAVRRTWDLMTRGTEIIAQAPIWNPQTRTHGILDLLVRSDVLECLFPGTLTAETSVPAPHLPGAEWHYRVVDVKFSTLDLLKNGHASAGQLHYAAQVWLYNEALGRLQGYTPPCGYLLGRAWKQTGARGASALERVCRVDRDHVRRSGERLGDLALAACDWVRRLRRDGAGWNVLPSPSVPELRPNMRNVEDAPWHGAKKRIAEALEDLTILPRVNPENRDEAIRSGLERWRDPACCAGRLGITGATYGPQVDAVIAANHSPADGPIVFPSDRVSANEPLWREPARVEFFVDFETVSDLDDDFSAFPRKGGQPLIFMVGCGSRDAAGEWQLEVFTVDRLALAEERSVLTAWIDHMRARCAASGIELADARIYHWSPAEMSNLETAYNSATERHATTEWVHLPWVDLLAKVVRAQPVSVRGAFGLGLKPIAKAMHAAGLIPTEWPDGVTDGLGAMVGAWWCDRAARARGGSMRDLDLMKEIEKYNRVDVLAMRDVLGWLRRNR
jgi:hypothetical protein